MLKVWRAHRRPLLPLSSVSGSSIMAECQGVIRPLLQHIKAAYNVALGPAWAFFHLPSTCELTMSKRAVSK
jgi:hypothetical protein